MKKVIAMMMAMLLLFSCFTAGSISAKADDANKLIISGSVEKTFTTTDDSFWLQLSTDKAGLAETSLTISGISQSAKVSQFKGDLSGLRDAITKGNDAFMALARGYKGVSPDTETSMFSFGGAKGGSSATLLIDLENSRSQSGTEVKIFVKSNIKEPTVEVSPIIAKKSYSFVQSTDDLYWPLNIETLSSFSLDIGRSTMSCDWCLCDANKNKIVSDANPTANSLNYPVIIDKGTYYIKTSLGDGVELEYGTMEFFITPVSNSVHSNNTKNKAKAIKINKKYTDVYTTVPEDEPHYYKFTLKKTKKITLAYSKDDNVGVTFALYKKNGKYVSSAYVNSSSSNSGTAKWGLTYKKNIKLKKGTYYIMIEKGRDTCDGKYTFMIK